MNLLPIYLIDENESVMIVNSIVSEPAHGKYALKFNKDIELRRLQFNDEKRIVTGVVLAANQPIYRRFGDHECYVVFTEKAIRNIALKYFKENKHNLIDIEHDSNIREEDVVMIESWFVDEHKTYSVDGQFVDKGSWIASYKVLNDEVWQLLKEGKLKGFSVDILATLNEFNLKPNNMKKEIKQSKQTLLNKIISLFEKELKFEEIETVDGVVLVYEVLEVGYPVYIKGEPEDVLAPAGQYKIDIQGVVYVIEVDEQGLIKSITEESNEQPQTEETEDSENTEETLEMLNERIAKLEDIITKMSKTVQHLEDEISKQSKKARFKAEVKDLPKGNTWKDINIKIR